MIPRPLDRALQSQHTSTTYVAYIWSGINDALSEFHKEENPMKRAFKTLGFVIMAAAIAVLLIPLIYHGGVADAQASPNPPSQEPIVGFWSTKFIAEGNTAATTRLPSDQVPPDGAVVDWGFQQWHSDGTEVHNSGVRPARSGDFCLGTWEIAGPLQYTLNHFATSWTPDGKSFEGIANIHEKVTVSQDHNSLTGTFTIDQYDKTGALLAHLAGNVQSKRITQNSTSTDVR
jgi:hypothetical protein